MGDRELLTRAAKAAGVRVPPENRWGGVNEKWGVYEFNEDGSQFRSRWNPLNDNADAFQLLVNLGLPINPEFGKGGLSVSYDLSHVIYLESWEGDAESLRRSIVKAAAHIWSGL